MFDVVGLTGLFDDVKQLQACLNISCRHGHKDLVEYCSERMKDIVGTTLSDFEFDPKYDLLKAARTGMYNHPSGVSWGVHSVRLHPGWPQGGAKK